MLSIIFLTCRWTLTLTQGTHEIDSLRHELTETRSDQEQSTLFKELCLKYASLNPDSAEIYGQRALELSRETQFTIGEVQALSALGFVKTVTGDLANALKLEYQAIQLAEENHLESELAGPLGNIGIVYGALRNYPKALLYFKQSRERFNSNKNRKWVSILNQNIGLAYLNIGQLDSALYFLTLRKNELEKSHEGTNAYFCGVIARLYGQLHEDEQALNFFYKGIRKAKEERSHRTLAVGYDNFSDFFEQRQKIDSSIHYAKLALAEAEVISYKQYVVISASRLAQKYELIDPKEAVRYYKLASAAREVLFGSGNLRAIETIADQEEQRRKDIDAAAIASRNQLKQYTLMTGATVFIVVAIILYRSNRQRYKANQVLQATLSNLRSTQSQLIQSEKMASLGELTAGIAHEIQNPLNFVNNFSEVNKELLSEMKEEIEKGNLEEAKSIAGNVINNQEKINQHGKRADAIVKGMLQHSRSSSGIKEPTNINTLAEEYLKLAYHGFRAKDNTFNVALKTNFDESISAIDVIPQDIGRVILNLLNNAFYAVSEKRKTANGYEPVVSLSTRKSGDKALISVSDNGRGISQKVLDKIFQPFFTTKPTGQGTGLGLSLSYDMVKAHGGELKVETKEGEGSEFIIQLPVV